MKLSHLVILRVILNKLATTFKLKCKVLTFVPWFLLFKRWHFTSLQSNFISFSLIWPLNSPDPNLIKRDQIRFTGGSTSQPPALKESTTSALTPSCILSLSLDGSEPRPIHRCLDVLARSPTQPSCQCGPEWAECEVQIWVPRRFVHRSIVALPVFAHMDFKYGQTQVGPTWYLRTNLHLS